MTFTQPERDSQSGLEKIKNKLLKLRKDQQANEEMMNTVVTMKATDELYGQIDIE